MTFIGPFFLLFSLSLSELNETSYLLNHKTNLLIHTFFLLLVFLLCPEQLDPALLVGSVTGPLR